MTLDTAHSKEVYQGNGTATVFPFAFKVWDTAQVFVTRSLPGQLGEADVTAQSTITLTENGGTVTYLYEGAPLPSGATLAIARNMPFTQGVDLVSASRFDPQVIEDALDQATAERQQTLEMMQRAVILPATSAETPQDVVRAVYAARDDAQTANSEAQAAMNTAANSATAAAASAAGAAGDADLARRWASEAEDVPVQAGEFSARHYSEKAKEAVPENLVGRVETLEGRTAPATTTSRGIARVATLADMEPGAVVQNGPAFPDVQGGAITPTPTPYAVPQADASGKLDGWVSLTGKADTDLSNVDLTKANVVLQTKRYASGAFAQGSTTMSYTNSTIPPQVTEGDQYMALTVTPKSAESLLQIDVRFVGGITAASNVTLALFKDGMPDALAASSATIRSAGGPLQLALSHQMESGTVSPITFTVRAGVNASATLQFNGSGVGANYGGKSNSSITITEYAA